MRETLFETVHGSRLYGLAHEGSDYDYYRVVTSESGNRYTSKRRFSKHRVGADDDTVVKDFSTWLHECEKGTPQALEAMFSTQATFDRLEAFRSSFRVSTGVLETYRRTMKNFAHSDVPKRRRHALRLALNARDLSFYGRFDPTLKPYQAEWVKLADAYDDEDLWSLCEMTFDTRYGYPYVSRG